MLAQIVSSKIGSTKREYKAKEFNPVDESNKDIFVLGLTESLW